jgi:hypothetical protein
LNKSRRSNANARFQALFPAILAISGSILLGGSQAFVLTLQGESTYSLAFSHRPNLTATPFCAAVASGMLLGTEARNVNQRNTIRSLAFRA